MIPKQLSELKFCRIRKQSKAPFEKDWTNKPYSYEEISKFDDGNYGVLCGIQSLTVIDCDREELTIAIEQLLPKTFSVRTGGGGTHFYYFIPELKQKIILSAGEEHLGEVQSHGQQVIGAGSIHPNGKKYEVINDVGIKEISLDELKSVIVNFMKVEETSIEKKQLGKITKEISNLISFEELLNSYGLKKKGNNWNCPFHKSVGGQCLSIDSEKGIFNCFHCGKKGNIISFVSELEGITIKESLKRLRKVKEEETIKPKEEITEQDVKKTLKKSYKEIIEILKYYMDVEEDDYSLITIWILGTYLHKNFSTYPYLFFNAMKGSGKSRVLNLIKTLTSGRLLTSLTEAILFRTIGTLCIDEFEGVGRKGNENLRELLNSAYKKGVNVVRFKKISGKRGEEQVEEEFEVYRPIIMANIWGMEEVLADRCIEIILEKSNKAKFVKIIENFERNFQIMEVVKAISLVNGRCGSFKTMFENTQDKWNIFIKSKEKRTSTTSIFSTHSTSSTSSLLYNKIDKTGLIGRDLELFLPLFLIADMCGVLDNFLKIAINITKRKKEKDIYESKDIQLYDFVSKFEGTEYIKVSSLTHKFKEFLGSEEKDKWPNTWWLGQALKRLKLIKEKKRSNGVLVILDTDKAKEKIKMFKEPEEVKEKQDKIELEKPPSKSI